MKKFLFECDLEKGPERFNVVGLDLDEVLALMLRQINLVYSSLLQNRPDLAKAVRMELITHMIDPNLLYGRSVIEKRRMICLC